MISTPDLAIGVGLWIQLRAAAERVRHASAPSQEDVEVLGEWFVIEPAPRGAAAAFIVEPTKRFYDLQAALDAPETSCHDVQWNAHAFRLRNIPVIEPDGLDEVGERTGRYERVSIAPTKGVQVSCSARR